MSQLPLIEISELLQYIVVSDTYQDMVMIADVDAQSTHAATPDGYTIPVRLNAIFIVMVLEGSIKISIDYVPYTIATNSFVTIMPSHVIQAADSSRDFKAKLLMVDTSFFEEYKPEKRSSALTNYMQIRKHPCTLFTSEETAHIEVCFSELRKKMQLRTHAFHREVMHNSTEAFFLELGNILIAKKEILIRPSLSRKEDIMNQFLQLLFDHAKEQHVVTFYADKLFITPQYLSLILKELTGKSANKWIDEALIVEAKVLLKAPQTTVQQVADKLNFSDQSTFGKFFKKHIGLSPMEYRKS
jgi:AraC-like DNA-binding protein